MHAFRSQHEHRRNQGDTVSLEATGQKIGDFDVTVAGASSSGYGTSSTDPTQLSATGSAVIWAVTAAVVLAAAGFAFVIVKRRFNR